MKKDRELGFFPGTAIGSLDALAAPYRLQDLRCAATVDLETTYGPANALYWGGCRFEADPDHLNVEVLARYAALGPEENVAAVRSAVGAGKAVLLGFHAEVRGEDFDRHRLEYPESDARHVRRTLAALYEGDAARRRFFRKLVSLLVG